MLQVRGLSVDGAVEDASFELRRGEILGFAGLVGAGRTELAEALVGLRAARWASDGGVTLCGKPLRMRARDAAECERS